MCHGVYKNITVIKTKKNTKYIYSTHDQNEYLYIKNSVLNEYKFLK